MPGEEPRFGKARTPSSAPIRARRSRFPRKSLLPGRLHPSMAVQSKALLVVILLILAFGAIADAQLVFPLTDDGTCDNRCRQRYQHDFCGTTLAGWRGGNFVLSDCQNCTGAALVGCVKRGDLNTRSPCTQDGTNSFFYTTTAGPLCDCNVFTSIVEGSVDGTVGGPDLNRKRCLP
jgi:hypothetical protein